MVDPGAALEFRVLGGVEALRNGSEVELGGRRQRVLLALLLLEPGMPVSTNRLIDELWHDRPPPGAARTLRSYVSRLRHVLGIDIPSQPSGYTLEVSPEQVDACRFEQLVREGRAALRRGASERASERLHRALELWQGGPFAGVGDEGALGLEAERLGGLRLAALEDRIEADLELEPGPGLVDELESLVRLHPYRERFWRQLMLALYRAERQADALDAYRRARAALDEGLGLEPSEELRSLEQAILRHNVPAVRAPKDRHNLPSPLTSFVGRESELADIERLQSEGRLVTLTGVGGVGKTRLALEAASRALPDFPDGVWFCDLSALTDPAFVPQHVATAIDVREQGGVAVDILIVARLREAELLLVLDNCEHQRESVAELAQSLLTVCPRLRVLATSRELLGCHGEIDYPVPPLESTDAVDLFLTRARAARPRLPDDEHARETAKAICSDLDGLPLALELAAARAKVLSLEEIASRLADRFRFLVSWRRLAAARHRTLREAMDWSYELLSPEEQAVLAAASVFAGGFTLEAVARVCLEEDDDRALDLIARLVNASLVVAEERNGATRYRLLETVRQYAAEQLDETERAENVRGRHADWCLELAAEAESHVTGAEQIRWLSILDLEHDNLRAALAHLGSAGDVERLLQLTVALSRFWYIRGYLQEGRRALEDALVGSDESDLSLRRRAFTAAASLSLLQGDYAVATTFAEHALAAARTTAEPLYVANGLSNLGAIVLAAGDHERAGMLLEEAVGLAREVEDSRILALALNNLGDLALTVGDYGRAEPLFDESLALLRARGDTANVARSLFNLGALALKLGRHADADSRFREAVAFAEQAGDKEDLAWCLEGFAGLEAAGGRGERAALLLGASGALLEQMGADFKPFERQLHEDTRTAALKVCGEEAFEAAARRGAALTLAEATEAALASRD